jgi:hypothetical protein
MAPPQELENLVPPVERRSIIHKNKTVVGISATDISQHETPGAHTLSAGSLALYCEARAASGRPPFAEVWPDLGTIPSRKDWSRDASHCVIGEQPMLPLLALTYTAARLGFEAQSAAAFRLLRLGAGITKAADEIVPHATAPADIAPTPVAAAPKRRHAAKRIHKKSAPIGKRSKRAKRG